MNRRNKFAVDLALTLAQRAKPRAAAKKAKRRAKTGATAKKEEQTMIEKSRRPCAPPGKPLP